MSGSKDHYKLLTSCSELDRAILKIENRRGKKQPWPPLNETSHDGQGIASIMDEEMGYVD